MRPIHRAGIALVLMCVIASAALGQTPAEDQADQRLITQMGKALTNDASSQYDLARMYEKGDGTPRDLRLAYLWYSKAANQGYQPAVQRLQTWDADIEKLERAEKQRLEQEERARQQAEAERQARQRAALEAKAKQEAEARAAREAARTRHQAEAAAKAAGERAAKQEAAKRKQAAPAEPAPTPAPAPVAAKAPVESAPTPAPAPATEKKESKEEAEKAEFSANPCKGPTAKFTSTCN